MVTIFALLFLASLLSFVVGIVKPFTFIKFINGSRKKSAILFGGLTMLFFILVGATAPKVDTKVASSTIKASPSVIFQTSTPTVKVIDTVTVSPSPVSLHNGVFVKVVNVVDGDTIKIESGETVRYIGMDTPETVHPSKPIQCYGKEASLKNTELVEGKTVELEKDVSEKDKYGRSLRYIWLDGVLINELLVREGYAQSSTYPPDVKYQNRFIAAQKLAREELKGLWSSACTGSVTPTPTIRPTQATTQTSNGTNTATAPQTQVNAASGSFTCNCSKTCAQMSSCAEAQYQLNTCGCSKRDGDGDGIACDSDCQ